MSLVSPGTSRPSVPSIPTWPANLIDWPALPLVGVVLPDGTVLLDRWVITDRDPDNLPDYKPESERCRKARKQRRNSRVRDLISSSVAVWGAAEAAGTEVA